MAGADLLQEQARINSKKGADAGIDDVVYFTASSMAEETWFRHRSNGKAIFQVKSRPGTRADLATLNSDRLRERADRFPHLHQPADQTDAR